MSAPHYTGYAGRSSIGTHTPRRLQENQVQYIAPSMLQLPPGSTNATPSRIHQTTHMNTAGYANILPPSDQTGYYAAQTQTLPPRIEFSHHPYMMSPLQESRGSSRPSRDPTSHTGSQLEGLVRSHPHLSTWLDNNKKLQTESLHGSKSASRIGMELPRNRDIYRFRYPPDLTTYHIDTTVRYPKDYQRNLRCPEDPFMAKRFFYLWEEEYLDQDDLLDYAGIKARCVLCSEMVKLGTVPYGVERWIDHWNACEPIQKAWDMKDTHNKDFFRETF
ncbi:hypothetical protein VKT23_008006 [Stygiomarasmius scandens]|uniref:Uncharacterized protein n=1 Tax=Marasmiellus scandens TaxID=2682957 RepID=A0ABR1JJU8_9AGAR